MVVIMAMFPFLIGKVLTLLRQMLAKSGDSQFPFLIGKVLTSDQVYQAFYFL